MKINVVTQVFTGVGILSSFFFLPWILGIIGIAAGAWASCVIWLKATKKTLIVVGILTILFCNIIAGILILCNLDNFENLNS